ncbi:MAG: tyrosine-type recombinase/integrase [Bdellovibrionaceae bacterium]|nr:tyrosine-type recombinase/integrase [Pseudobdellovibrionaceae bacterium]
MTRADGTTGYKVDVTIKGQRIRQVFDKAEAEKLVRAEKQEKLERMLGVKAVERVSEVKLRDLIRGYWDDVVSKRVSSCSRRLCRINLTRFYDYAHGERSVVYVSEVTTSLIWEWRDKLIDDGFKPSTVNYKMNAVRGMFTREVEAKRMKAADNPFDGYSDLKAVSEARMLWKPQWVDLFISHALEPIRSFIEALAGTGMRPIELLSVTWRMVDFDSEILTVRCGKNAGELRSFPLDQHLREVFEAIKPANAGLDERVWKLSYNRMWEIFTELRDELGLPKKLSFYGLRHTFATDLMQENVQVFKVQQLMGHKNVATTMRYVHVQMDDMRNGLKTLRDTRGA